MKVALFICLWNFDEKIFTEAEDYKNFKFRKAIMMYVSK